MVKIQLTELAREELTSCRPIVVGLGQRIDVRFADILDCETDLGEKSAITALSMPMFKNTWFPCISQQHQIWLLRQFKKLIAERLPLDTASVPAPSRVDPYFNFSMAAQPRSSEPNGAESTMNNHRRSPSRDLSMLRDFAPMERIFRQYNTAPPSSAEVERLFNHATMMNALKSNRISVIRFEQRVLLRKNSVFLRGDS